jgi:hypothetical protein
LGELIGRIDGVRRSRGAGHFGFQGEGERLLGDHSNADLKAIWKRRSPVERTLV